MEEKAKPGLTAARAEELLILFAKAINNRNVAAAQQAVHALQSISSVDGELSTERVTAYFTRALMIRASTLLQSSQNLPHELDPAQYMHDHIPHQVRWGESALGFNDLTHLVDMTPYYRFGYMAANGAILEAFEGMDRVHIVDFSTSHCMQWPTLIDSLAARMHGPPHVRLTVSTSALPTPPRLHPSYEEVGHRLTLWAREKGVPFEFHILSRPLESLCISDMNLREGESLAVNCSLRLHYLGDESLGLGFGSCSTPPSSSESEGLLELCPRDKFLQLIACLNPAVVTVYEEDCNATSTDLVARVMESYNHEWIPFDYLATYALLGRREHERDLGLKIENLVACEGVHRIERLESMSQWSRRLRRLNFLTLPVSDDVVTALREMVGDYAGGWGMKIHEDIEVLNWKGNSLAFASAWVPAPPPIKLSDVTGFGEQDSIWTEFQSTRSGKKDQEEIAVTECKPNRVSDLSIHAIKPGSHNELPAGGERRDHAELKSNVTIESKPSVKYDVNVVTNQWHEESNDTWSNSLQGFVAHLKDALSDAGFRPLIDSSQLQNEVSPMDDILSDACVHVPIFSWHYAESTQCLKELCYMLQSGKVIIPVFYDILRGHLRQIEDGPLNKAFRKHQERENPEEVKNWKQALYTIADFRSTHKSGGGDQLVSFIVAAVQRESMGVPEEDGHHYLDVYSSLSCRSNLSVGLSSTKRDVGDDDLTEQIPDNVVLMPLDDIILIAGYHADDSDSAAFGLYCRWQSVSNRHVENILTLQKFRDIISTYSAKSEAFDPKGDVSIDTSAENNLRYWPDMLVNLIQKKLYISYPSHVQPLRARVLVGSTGQNSLRFTATSSGIEGRANEELIPPNVHSVFFQGGVWKVVGVPSLVRSSGESYMETPQYIEPLSSPSSPSPNPDYLEGKVIMGSASDKRGEYGPLQKMTNYISKYGYVTHVLQLTVEDDFVIFGSSLFWDLVNVCKATEIVQNTGDPEVAARELVKYALSCVISENIEYISNVTALVLFIGRRNNNFLVRKQKKTDSIGSERDESLIKLLQEESTKLDGLFKFASSDSVSFQNLSKYGETTILFHFNTTDDLFEFHFKNCEGMACIIGVGLEYGKVILEDGWQVKVIEILKQDWEEEFWKSIKPIKRDSFKSTNMKIISKIERKVWYTNQETFYFWTLQSISYGRQPFRHYLQRLFQVLLQMVKAPTLEILIMKLQAHLVAVAICCLEWWKL